MNNALIIRVRKKCPTGRKKSNMAKQAIVDKFGSEKKSISTSKRIYGDSLKDCERIARECDAFVKAHTLPWGDNGDRFLPTANYKKVYDGVRGYVVTMETEAENLIAKIDLIKRQAENDLNGLFDATDYKDADTIKSSIGITMETEFLPSIGDARIALSDSERISLEAEITENTKRKLGEAKLDAWEKLHNAVEKFAESIGERPNGDAKSFHNTAVSTLADVLDILPSLNFDANQKFDDTVKFAKAALTSMTAEDLKSIPVLRDKVKEYAKRVLDTTKQEIEYGW